MKLIATIALLLLLITAASTVLTAAPNTTATSTAAPNTTAASTGTSQSTTATGSTSSTTATTLSTTTPYPLCSIVNSSIVSGSFQLTVTPTVLSSNSIHTVKVNGSGNATIVLQAMGGANLVGSWSSGNHTCAGNSPLFEISSNTTLVAYWTSNSQNPTEIRAFIRVNDTSKLTYTLNPATTTAPPKTTSAGSTSHVTLPMAFTLLLISTKLLI